MTVVVSAAVIAVVLGLERFAPRAPAPLVAVALAIAASALFHLQARGVAIVGEVPGGLPSLTLPQFAIVEQLWPAALGIALMSFTETIAASRAFAVQDEPHPEPNRELLALGVANVAGGMFNAMPAGGGTSQTAVNRLAGARSKMAGLVTAAGALATLLLLAPYIALMPQAVLAAVVIVYSFELIKPAEFREIRRVRAQEFRWAVVAFLGVVFLGTLQGIVVAVIVSLLGLAHQAYTPVMYSIARKRGTAVFRQVGPEHPDDERWPGLLMLRLDGRLFFANAQRVTDLIWALEEKERPEVVVLDCRAVVDVEYTALKALAQLEDKLRRHDVEFWLAGMTPAVFVNVERPQLG